MNTLIRSLLFLILLPPAIALAGELPKVTVYKSPTCGCCSKWVDHMEANGFEVIARDVGNMDQVKNLYGINRPLQSCHTAVVNGYLIEGHVPAGDVKRLLKERPAVIGLSVPGMPMGSPGMEGPYKDDYATLSWDQDGQTKVFERH